jgi:hypothetical protein
MPRVATTVCTGQEQFARATSGGSSGECSPCDRFPERAGVGFDIDLERHEWRMTNLYWLGRVPLFKVMFASLITPEHSLK